LEFADCASITSDLGNLVHEGVGFVLNPLTIRVCSVANGKCAEDQSVHLFSGNSLLENLTIAVNWTE
jgi:hypothetical protein